MIDMDFRTERYGTEDFWLEEQMTSLGLSRRIGGKGKLPVGAVSFDNDFNNIRYGRVNMAWYIGRYFDCYKTFNGLKRVKMEANNNDYAKFCEIVANLRKMGCPEIDCSPKAYGDYITNGFEFPEFYPSDFGKDKTLSFLTVRINREGLPYHDSSFDYLLDNMEKDEVPRKGLSALLRYLFKPFQIFGAGISLEGSIGRCKEGCQRLEETAQDIGLLKKYNRTLRGLNRCHAKAWSAAGKLHWIPGLVFYAYQSGRDEEDKMRDRLLMTFADVLGIEDLKKENAQIEGETYPVNDIVIEADRTKLLGLRV